MIRQLFLLLRRDLAMLLPGGRRGGTMLPLLFFMAVAINREWPRLMRILGTGMAALSAVLLLITQQRAAMVTRPIVSVFIA